MGVRKSLKKKVKKFAVEVVLHGPDGKLVINQLFKFKTEREALAFKSDLDEARKGIADKGILNGQWREVNH